ncbi:MAG: hypothetical protein R3C19_02320 [Planctomycetaceae bacterium]
MATSLHQQLKLHYVEDTARHEVDVGGYRIDAVDRRRRLIEIQCASLGAIRDKIRRLLQDHKVIVAKPLALNKVILKKARRNGQVVSRRVSPAHQTLPHVFLDLVHFSTVFPHPNLRLDILLTEQEEVRVPPKRPSWRRKFSVQERRLVAVQQAVSVKTAADLWKHVDFRLPEEFTTADMAADSGMPRWLAQKAAYCFRQMSHIEVCGKQGNAVKYRLLKGVRRRTAA